MSSAGSGVEAPGLGLSVIPGHVLFTLYAVASGAALIAFAIGDPRPLLGVWLPLLMLVCLVRPWRNDAMHDVAARTAICTYAVCILVAGVCHVYSTAVFGSPVDTTIEVPYFYERAQGPMRDDPPLVNAPYALMTWRVVFDFASWCGLGNGVWIGLTINSLLVALSAFLIVRTFALIRPDDVRRARLLERFILWSPFLWIFGALLVRDAFALVLQALVLLTFVSFLLQPGLARGITHAAAIAVLALLVIGVRIEMLTVLPVLAILAAMSIVLQHRGLKRVGWFVAGGVLALLIAAVSIERIVQTIFKAQEGYYEMLRMSGEIYSGLGYKLVVSQPLPIRVIAGSLYLHMFPIPFWTSFNFDSFDYHWMKGFSAVFMIVITPFAVLGAWRCLQRAKLGVPGTAPTTFIAIYWPTMLAAVAVTSLETRHLAQFLPALLILAVLPDLRDERDRRAFRWLACAWYGAVIFGHILWLAIQ